MLTCKGLTLENKNGCVFKNVSFTLLPTSITIITGNNGQGKSCLLKTILGLIKQNSGSISWNNIDINDDIDAFRQNISYLGHYNALNLELTVKENLKFWAKLTGGEELLEAAAQYFQLHELFDLPLASLSTGWQRRVSLARILLTRSNLWILDEPDVNLDSKALELLVNLIKIRARDGGVILIAGHRFDSLTEANYINLGDFKDE